MLLGITLLVAFCAFVLVAESGVEEKFRLKERTSDALREEQRERKVSTKWRRVLSDLAMLDQKESLDQLEALLAKCERFDTMLKSRFSSHELTSGRYRVVVDEVRLGVLNNLDRQVELLKAVQHLDRAAIEARIRAIEPGAPASVQLEKALYERLSLVEDVGSRVARMIASNELALNALDKAIVSLADLDTRQEHDTSKLEAAVADLELMIGNAHAFAAGTEDLELYGSKARDGKDKKTIELAGGSGE